MSAALRTAVVIALLGVGLAGCGNPSFHCPIRTTSRWCGDYTLVIPTSVTVGGATSEDAITAIDNANVGDIAVRPAR